MPCAKLRWTTIGNCYSRLIFDEKKINVYYVYRRLNDPCVTTAAFVSAFGFNKSTHSSIDIGKLGRWFRDQSWILLNKSPPWAPPVVLSLSLWINTPSNRRIANVPSEARATTVLTTCKTTSNQTKSTWPILYLSWKVNGFQLWTLSLGTRVFVTVVIAVVCCTIFSFCLHIVNGRNVS